MPDPLSDVLRSIRLTGAMFLEAHFTAPWCVLAAIEPDDCAPFAINAAQIVGYHFVVDGTLVAGIEGEPSIEVCAGEVVLFPRNDAHTLASATGVEPVDTRNLVQPSADGGLARIVHGGGGDPVHLICGFLATAEPYNPMLASLPRMLKLDVDQGASRDWVEASVRFAAGELTKGRVATSGMMSRLSELLLVEAVRNYSSTLGDHETGWLKGLTDPHVGRALATMHQHIGASWSAETLAREVGLSRSTFVERFTKLVGMPPIRYLTLLRLQAAKLSLQETRTTIAQLAHSVGYESEEAFSRAFKRAFGMSPAHWRGRPSAGAAGHEPARR